MEGEMDQQQAELETEMELQRTELEADMDQQRADMQAALDQQRIELDQQRIKLDQQKAELDQKHASQTTVHPNVQSELQSELTQLTRQHAKLESELVEQRTEFEAELTRLIQQRSEYEAELTEQRAELEQSASAYRAQIADQHAEITRLTAIPSARPDAPNEVHALRLRALDAEARALSAEEALAVLSDTAVPATSALSPAEKRLREMRGYRHSTVLHKTAEPVTPASDKFASYPELQLAASPAPARSSPVFDADQVHTMLRDAALDAERQASFDRERRALQAKIAELRETKKELQGHNSQFKNLMRDLGEKLVGLAQENDALEAKAGDRDELAAEVAKLTLFVEELQARLADASERVKAGAERASVSLRSASDTLDSPPMHVMQSRLQSIESELAAHVDRACQAEEQRDLYCTELHRARADLRRLSTKAEEQKEEHDRRKHRFSRLLCLV
ncbi:hypothetical protein IW136_005706 [Coemansia sp. RSA 678]|nr:hypothetical protein IW136_005706 [Coemansia sp. RSA 678]